MAALGVTQSIAELARRVLKPSVLWGGKRFPRHRNRWCTGAEAIRTHRWAPDQRSFVDLLGWVPPAETRRSSVFARRTGRANERDRVVTQTTDEAPTRPADDFQRSGLKHTTGWISILLLTVRRPGPAIDDGCIGHHVRNHWPTTSLRPQALSLLVQQILRAAL